MKFLPALTLFFCLLVPAAAWAHPGKTDSKGCHQDNGNFHCHAHKALDSARERAKDSNKSAHEALKAARTDKGGAKKAALAEAEARNVIKGQVVRVSDGDTIVVRAAGSDTKVRLYGLDAPESDQPGGPEAAEALRRIIQGKPAKVTVMDMDQSRAVGLVEHEGLLVNLDLVKQGHAWHYGHFCDDQPVCSSLMAAEAEARSAKRGLWAQENPLAPWEWRRNKEP